jgi:hypothetical protein
MSAVRSRQYPPLRKIVSGGQTGVDRGALDAAIALGIDHGGWCPNGRLAEDGVIPKRYRLQELKSTEYAARTEQNVVDSDGTLILYRERMTGGTALTNRLAKERGKPLLRVRLDQPIRYREISRWIAEEKIEVLNIAGPRGSSDPELESLTYAIVQKICQALTQSLPLDDS